MNKEQRAEMVLTLVRLAGCERPDSPTSPGSDYLDTVALSLSEALENGRLVKGDEHGTDGEYRPDVISEVAGESLPANTHPMWEAFVDLGAYSNDFDEGTEYREPEDMARGRLEALASRALTAYMDDLDENG